MPDALATHPLIETLMTQQAVGVALVDRERRYLRINPALAELNGRPVEQHLGRTVREVLAPEIAAEAEALVDSALAGQALVDVEVRVPGADGEERILILSYLPVVAEEGIVGVLALLVDATARGRAEEQLEVTRRRLYLALEGTNTGTFEYDVATGRGSWSDNMGPLFGRPRGWAPADVEEYRQSVHPDDRPAIAVDAERVAAAGAGYEREYRALLPDGTPRWLHAQVHVVRGPDGAPAALVGLVHDIEARKQRERRAEFLARAGLALADSLDAPGTLQHVAELAVQEMSDWCTVVVADAPGRHSTLAVAHRDPERAGLARELLAHHLPSPDARPWTPAVIRTGRSELLATVDDAMLVAAARNPEHLALLRALEVRSVMIVALVARGRTLGAMTFAYGPGRRAYGPDDVELAEELGRRAGLALDNARLYQTVRGTAMTLQRSLLPDTLPEVAGWEAAARYLPGEAGAAVGGDWYDLFALPNGTFALVVGDVMGRGIPAAAGMGRLRSALQAHLFDTWDPAAALERLDDIVEALRIVPFATALAVVMDPATGDLRACSAGHPPPLLIGPRPGYAEVPPGPPVGARVVERQAAALSLERGESIVLYTDGLVEARESPLDTRLALLRDLIAAGPPDEAPGALLDRAIDGMLGPSAPDDVAVVAVRRS